VSTGAEPMIFHQRIQLPYRYTAGTAHKAFLRGLAQRRIVGCRCERCQLTLAPARPFCPRCSTPTGDPVKLGTEGRLDGWTTVHRNGRSMSFGLVTPDGADTALVHRLDIPAGDLANGARVRPRWAAEPVGEITDIEAFELA